MDSTIFIPPVLMLLVAFICIYKEKQDERQKKRRDEKLRERRNETFDRKVKFLGENGLYGYIEIFVRTCSLPEYTEKHIVDLKTLLNSVQDEIAFSNNDVERVLKNEKRYQEYERFKIEFLSRVSTDSTEKECINEFIKRYGTDSVRNNGHIVSFLLDKKLSMGESCTMTDCHQLAKKIDPEYYKFLKKNS